MPLTRSPVSINANQQPVTGMAWVSSSHGRQVEGAVIGGTEPGGMYVGRVHHRSGDLLPGKVHLNYGVIYVPWGGKEHNFSSYEVLTELNPSNPVTGWRHSEQGIVQPSAIQGGVTSNGERLYIGRARINGVLCCGKIHPSHHALYISYGGKEHAFKTGYEILIYRAPPLRPPLRPPPRPQLPPDAHTPSAPVQNRFPGRGQPLASAQEIQGILERIRTTETLETARRRAMASRRPARPPPPLSSTTGAVSSSNPLKNSSCAGEEIEQPNQEGSFTCQICFEKYNGNWGLLHGGTMHAGYCQGCAQKLKNDKAPCPQCRCEVEAVIKVFMN